MADLSTLVALLVATLGGAAIGVERQRSGHASGERAHFAGVRTFTMLGLIAGMAGWLARSGYPMQSAALIAGPAALIVVSYGAASRRDIDGTTEVAAFVTLAAGSLSGLGATSLASGIIAITVLLLVEKSQLHSLVARLDDEELRAAARFGVMAIVILPLLPSGPFGPFGGVKPRELWLLVLFFTGLSFIGYFARRSVGATRGYPLAGALAGIVSSTNVTFTFARLSRAGQVPPNPLATGAIAACTVLFPRVLVATAVLSPAVASALLPYLVAPFLCGLTAVGLWLRSGPPVAENQDRPDNPLQIWPALQMAATFQVVLFLVELMRRTFGDAGVLGTGAVLGLTDVDALTISMARSASTGISPRTAAEAVAVGILANSAMKAAIAWALGTREFARRTGAALAAMATTLAVTLWWLR